MLYLYAVYCMLFLYAQPNRFDTAVTFLSVTNQLYFWQQRGGTGDTRSGFRLDSRLSGGLQAGLGAV